MAFRTSPFALRYSSVFSLTNAAFFAVSLCFISVVNHGLSFPYIVTRLVTEHISSHQLMYDVTVSVNSSMSPHDSLNMFQSVQSKQPRRTSYESSVIFRTTLFVGLIELSFWRYVGMSSTVEWSDSPKGAPRGHCTHSCGQCNSDLVFCYCV